MPTLTLSANSAKPSRCYRLESRKTGRTPLTGRRCCQPLDCTHQIQRTRRKEMLQRGFR